MRLGKWGHFMGVRVGDVLMAVDGHKVRDEAPWWVLWSSSEEGAHLTLRRSARVLGMGSSVKEYDPQVRKTADQIAFLEKEAQAKRKNPHAIKRRMESDPRFIGQPDEILAVRVISAWIGRYKRKAKERSGAEAKYDLMTSEELGTEMAKRGLKVGRKKEKGMRLALVENDVEKKAEADDAEKETYEAQTLVELQAICIERGIEGYDDSWALERMRAALVEADVEEGVAVEEEGDGDDVEEEENDGEKSEEEEEEEEEGEEVFEVEKFMGTRWKPRVKKRELQLRCRWLNFGSNKDSWEPRSEMVADLTENVVKAMEGAMLEEKRKKEERAEEKKKENPYGRMTYTARKSKRKKTNDN